jgi:ribokinase
LGRELDVLAVGNINVDLSFFVDRAPSPDSEAFAHRFSAFHGGSAANFSVGVAKLGLKSAILACVGDDSEGSKALNALKEEGVVTDFVGRVENAKTGTVCVIVEPDGTRRMIAYRGANAHLEGFAGVGVAKASPKVVQLCNVSRKVLNSVAEKKGRWKLSVDPGGSSGEIKPEDLEGAEIVILNDKECQSLTGKAWKQGAALLSEKACKVVVKRGALGAYLISQGMEMSCKAFKVEVADTTGAGDAFDAGFVSAFCRGLEDEECLRWGSAAAALKIQSRGARNGLATEKCLKNFLNSSLR